jgi:thiol:disulfide interchange protein DsbD
MTRPLLTFARRLALLLVIAPAVLAGGLAQAADDFLPVKQAFRPTATFEDGELTVRYAIAQGYYLYRDRLGFESATPGVTVGPAALPVGLDHEDEFFGKQVIYRGDIAVGVQVAFDGSPRDFEVKLKLQGCADGGLCYPPQTWTTPVSVSSHASAGTPPAAAVAPPARQSAGAEPPAPAPGTASGGGFSLKRLLGGGTKSDADFLPVDQAFAITTSSPSRDRIVVRFDIADDYYLYRDKTRIVAQTPDVQLGDPRIPGGEIERDDYFGEQVVFRGEMVAEVPVAATPAVREVPLEISFQGCAEAGLCYPPTKKQFTVTLASAAAPAAVSGRPGSAPVRSETDALADRIRSGNLLAVLASFFGAGLLLAFTPCVLPMIPILSGIIVGAGRGEPVSRGRAFSLSLAYVLGMALTYTVAGAVFAAAGQQAQAFFQQPWILVLFAGLFVVLALAMFGLFNLQVPAALQSRINELSSRQKQGSLAGTAVMGALSSLIVTACVAPPLVAALAVIGQSGDVLRGAAALFALSLGMGAPLLLLGASAGKLLPRAGAWMDTVKFIFGLMFLGVAIWMLGRLLPGPVTLGLWGLLALFTAGYLGVVAARNASPAARNLWRGAGLLAALYGVLLVIGALRGHENPLQPLAGLGTVKAPAGRLEFQRIKSVADFERELASATAAGRPVMLDFYADWCVSCKEMEHYTFPDPGVRAALGDAVLLQADVTANDDEDQALLQRFGILGPPTIVFFDAAGRERPEYRVVGFKKADEFRGLVASAFGRSGT